MAISNVKSALVTDLKAISGINTVYGNFMEINRVNNFPSLAVWLANSPTQIDGENNVHIRLNYGIAIYVVSSTDTDESGDGEDTLTAIYESIISKLTTLTNNLWDVDGVEGLEIKELIPDVFIKNKGAGYIPITIEYIK